MVSSFGIPGKVFISYSVKVKSIQSKQREKNSVTKQNFRLEIERL